MKNLFCSLRLVALLLLVATNTLSIQAETVTHTFGELGAQFSDGNATVTLPDGLVYHCTNTTFGINSGRICAMMNTSGAALTLANTMSELSGLRINYDPTNTALDSTNIAIYLSTDGEEWTQVTKGFTAIKGSFLASGFAPNDYYVRIERASGLAFYIFSIAYTLSPCSCLEVK